MNICRDCTGKQAETMYWQGFASDRQDMGFLSNRIFRASIALTTGISRRILRLHAEIEKPYRSSTAQYAVGLLHSSGSDFLRFRLTSWKRYQFVPPFCLLNLYIFANCIDIEIKLSGIFFPQLMDLFYNRIMPHSYASSSS